MTSHLKPDAFEPGQIFRKGFGLKESIRGDLIRDYHSPIVEKIIQSDHVYSEKGLTFHLAKSFGFCYGVDRAVDLAYETRQRFPQKKIYLTAQIIHNPRVNRNLKEMGIEFLENYSTVQKEDVVILPAFGATAGQIETLKEKKCVLVDTTCGSVLNVWKRVESYAEEGFSSVIHGKYYHEETQATSSRVFDYPQGKFLVVLDMEEAGIVCDYIENGGDSKSFLRKFEKAVSPGFDPDKDLQKVGVANQTTMLMSESLAIAEKLRKALEARYGATDLKAHFRNFDTICSATEDRQLAMRDLVGQTDLDLILVIGGFNSSNTNHLAEMASEKVSQTYHIEDAHCIVSSKEIRHKPVGQFEPIETRDWLPEGPLKIGVTSGASTPNQVMGDTIERILSFR